MRKPLPKPKSTWLGAVLHCRIVVHPHQRCGYSDSPFSRGYTFSILQGPETDLREWKRCVDTPQNIKPYQKDTCFLYIEKYNEDVRQDEKHVPDLLESIMRPKLFVKDELRPNSFKIDQCRAEVRKIQVWSKSLKFQNGPVDHPSRFLKRPNPFVQYLAPLGAKYIAKRLNKNSNKCGF